MKLWLRVSHGRAEAEGQTRRGAAPLSSPDTLLLVFGSDWRVGGLGGPLLRQEPGNQVQLRKQIGAYELRLFTVPGS